MGLKSFFGLKKDDEPSSLSDFLTLTIGRVEKLGQKVASEIMIPRVDATALSIGQPFSKVIEIMKDKGYSRFPVWKDKLDNIVGVLYVKDLLYRMSPDGSCVALKEEVINEDMLRESFFIPESKKVESLLKEFQTKKVHMAVVLDEYGGFSGIVTLEDIIEVIVGDIQDEYDSETADIREMEENIYELDARTALDELEEQLGLDFTDYKEEIDTIGGLIYNTLERIPSIGEHVEINGDSYQVIKKEGNKILSLKASISPRQKEEDEG